MGTLDTAGRLVWVADADRAAEVNLDSAIPVIEPPQLWRRYLWESVLRSYGLDSGGTRRPDCARGDGHDVVGVGAEAAVPAAILAALLGRRSVQVDSLAALERHMRSQTPASILGVALARGLSARHLERLTATASTCGVAIGVVTGRDIAGLTFSAAKLVAARRWLDEPDLSLDGLAGTQLDGDGLRRWDDVAATLSERWRTLILLAHGEGAHARLGDLVICGVAEEREHHADGRAIDGCVRGVRCKRAPQGAARALLDVRARVLVLLSCNGLSLAGELYPSSASMALAAAESFPAAFLSATRRVVLESSHAALVYDALAAGATLGRAARLLNGDGAVGAQPYLVCGDPCWAPAGGAALERPGGGEGRAARSAPRGLEDRIGDIGGRLDELARRLVWASAFERALACGPARSRPAGALRLTATRRRLEARTWLALREVEQGRQRGCWPGVLDALDAQVAQDVGDWAQAAAALLHDGAMDASFAELLHFFSVPSAAQPANRCERCSTTTEHTVLSALLPGLGRRVVVDCPVCGPLQEHAVGEPAVRLRGPASAVAGERAIVDLLVEGSHEPPEWDAVWVVAQLSDKAVDGSLSRLLRRHAAPADTVTLAIDVPLHASPDLQTLRVAVVGAVRVAFARWRIAVMPGAGGGEPWA